MSLKDKLAGESEDPVVAEALRDFKRNVDAWSQAAYARRRTDIRVQRHSWRFATAWAVGGVVAISGLTTGLFEHRQEQARVALRLAEQSRTATELNATAAQMKDEDLLATVDSDVSRQVPAAMEPLAQMMDEIGTESGTE